MSGGTMDELRDVTNQIADLRRRQEALLRELHPDHSLRELGVAAGMSHQSVRNIVHSGHHTGVYISVGYEGRNVDDLVATLKQARVALLVDVREMPLSRKKGFSKTALSEQLSSAGIEYLHMRELGNPKDNREPFRAGHRSARTRFLGHLNNGSRPAFDQLVEMGRGQRVALLCFEADHSSCHRSCITDQIQEEHPAVSVQRL